jgi:uncharacterized membrane protein HdeD (DUF308 family)
MANVLGILILIIAILFLVWAIYNLYTSYKYFPQNKFIAWLFLIIAVLVVVVDFIAISRPNIVVV